MNNYYYIKENSFQKTYNKIKEKKDFILDIVKYNGLGFYSLNKKDFFKDTTNPQWYKDILENKIDRIIFKNIEYISFNSTGFKLYKQLCKENKIILPDKEIVFPDTINTLIIPDKEWLDIFNNENFFKLIEFKKN